MILNERSIKNLAGVHPDLVKIVHRAAAITTVNFIITEGMRSITRQQELFKQGKTTTMISRHLTGHAVDFAVWLDKNNDDIVNSDELSWVFDKYTDVANAFKTAARELNIPIEWGGDWKSFKDGPHIQLSKSRYP